MSAHVLIVDDDTRLAAMVSDYLDAAGFTIAKAASGKAAAIAMARMRFDAVILDLMLPDCDGFDLCRRIRTQSDVPVLMLTARGEETDRIVGLELGADDYLPKPFNPRELLARLRAILRRNKGGQVADQVMCFGRLQIDPGSRGVRVDGQDRTMTSYQFDLLVALARNAGLVLNRERLLDLVKGEEIEAFDRSVDVHVSRIRSVIEDDPKHPRRIITVRGSGYVFAKTQDAEP